MPTSIAANLYGILTPLAAAATGDGLDSLFGSSEAVASSSDVSMLASSLRMLAALGAVLALLILTLWALRRMTGKWAPALAGSKGSSIEVISQKSLGGRRTLTVVRWEGRKILLGVAGDSISALAIEDDDTPVGAAKPFDEQMHRALGEGSGPVFLDDSTKGRGDR